MKGSLAANSRDRSARIPAVEPRTTRPADMGTQETVGHHDDGLAYDNLRILCLHQ